MKSQEIRDKFLTFFHSKGHTIYPSAPMVVKDDPTLMFTNAGMNQFKEWFLGNSAIRDPRVANSQKCLRVSGKHNDLEEVGHDTYHHTMFEMLGNWSFGDYFKKEAIEWAWELLTEVYKLDKNRLYATVFEGDKEDGTDEDLEAKEEWLKYLPTEHVIYGNKRDNFWEMGESGPCGPCSELHIDLRSEEEREKKDGALLVNRDHPLVVEIWNLVFIEFNRSSDGTLHPLPSKHVDTGMGLERLCMALQGKKSNYDTDLFTGMIKKISQLSGKTYGEEASVDIAMRVIADHIRAIAFSIADGQLPSNVRAGYVIRRILRRAVRYGYTFLEMESPLLYQLVPQLIDDLGEAYPELKRGENLITKVIEEEEETFLRTLGKGIALLDGVMEKSGNDKKISGKEAFTLYDTYGFPLDLTELIASERGFTIDQKEFESEMEKQKERSRQATSSKEGDWIELAPYQECHFTGDRELQSSVTLLRYRKVTEKKREYYQLIFDQTPFYAEGGGQVGDSGTIDNGVEKIEVVNTVTENNLHIHIVNRLPKELTLPFIAKVDEAKRRAIAANHTATHLLHHALREILGKHIEQKGSLVAADRLRFDFSHFEKIEEEQLLEIERYVNRAIRENITQQEESNLTMEEAIESGAIALFGERYEEKVRVIKFGESMELCGGTHVHSTGEIGLFKIVSEGAIAAGVRRVEATTAIGSEKYVEQLQQLIGEVKASLNNSPNIAVAVEKLATQNEELKEQLNSALKREATSLKKELEKSSRVVDGITLYQLQGEQHPEVVRNVAHLLNSDSERVIFAAAYSHNKKPFLTLLYSKPLVEEGYNASNRIKEASRSIKGGGGGQPFLATAGGNDVAGLESALESLVKTEI